MLSSLCDRCGIDVLLWGSNRSVSRCGSAAVGGAGGAIDMGSADEYRARGDQHRGREDFPAHDISCGRTSSVVPLPPGIKNRRTERTPVLLRSYSATRYRLHTGSECPTS